MTNDKIAEIKRRHLTGERYGPATAAHDDRATLLAEVERLRDEVKWLREERNHLLTENMKLHGAVGKIRKALEGAP